MSILWKYWTESCLAESVQSTYQHVIELVNYIDISCQIAEPVCKSKARQAHPYTCNMNASNIEVRTRVLYLLPVHRNKLEVSRQGLLQSYRETKRV